MYHSADQARMRLSGCLVRLEGKWVKVVSVEGGARGAIFIHTYPIGVGVGEGVDKEVTVTKLTEDLDFDPKSVKLGYIKTPVGWQYCYRVPERRWKQGLHPDNIRCYNRRALNGLFTSEYMLNCLTNNYLSVEKAIEGGGAFNRYFAISGANLWYRGTKVGKIALKQYFDNMKPNLSEEEKHELYLKVFQLEEKYQYLKQQLELALKC